MFGVSFDFDSPWYLLLLLLVPLVWIWSFRSLAGLGKVRRLVAIGLRTVVLVLLVLALAEIQFRQTSDRLTVIYLLDQSESIPLAQRLAMLEYAVEEVSEHRDNDRADRAGLIIFGRNAAIEVPPHDDDLPLAGRVESLFVKTDATSLAAALKLAQATFPEDSARRIVLITDGNENLGTAESVGRLLADTGVGIDVVPVQLGARAEVAVEKVTLPDEMRKGQPVEARIVVNNLTKPTADNPGTVRGTLRLVRISGDGESETLDEQTGIDLPPGKSVFSFTHEIERPDFYTYEARFEPDDPRNDLMQQNNRATAFTHVRGQGHVLLIEDWENPGEFAELVARLGKMNIEVTVRASNQLFTSLAELQRYDCILLGNVARSSGADDANEVTSFSDEQIDMLVRNTQQMGSGLIMLGGDRSFGAGGWANTELEKAMPVDFTIKNSKVAGVGALVLLMHASEMAQGNHWQKVVAREAVKMLGPMDYCGLLHYGMQGDAWLWKDNQGSGVVRIGENRPMMLRQLGRMTPGDMPDFDPAMRLGLAGLNTATDASVKHMIIISDGDPSPPSPAVIRAFVNAPPAGKGIPITTVAIGAHGAPGSTPLQKIATATGGKYYVVNNPKALPKIYQREVRRITRPLIHEKPVTPQIQSRPEYLRGIDEKQLPPISGFVLTTIKENPLVEVAAVSPEPAETKYSTILASWTYGLGRTAVLTTDAGHRWAGDWKSWDHYDLLFSQLVRWAMRPTEEQGKFTVSTDVREGKVRVVVTALDKGDEFLNFLNISGSIVGPDMESKELKIEQTAPGRYVGEFAADQSGSYFLTMTPGPGKAPIRAGVNVPYSAEFTDHETNLALLQMLAQLKPQGGKPGEVIQGPLQPGQIDQLLEVNTFRRTLAKAVSRTGIWHLLLLAAACLFFADVFFRRVTVGFAWLAPVGGWLATNVLGREPVAVPDERLARLRSRKQQITGAIDERRSSTRFEPDEERQLDAGQILDVMNEPTGPSDPTRGPTGIKPPSEEPDDETHTRRLLDVKDRLWKDRRRQQPDDGGDNP